MGFYGSNNIRGVQDDRTFVTHARLTPNLRAMAALFFTLPESNSFRYNLACSAGEGFFFFTCFWLTDLAGLQKFAPSRNGYNFAIFGQSTCSDSPSGPPLMTLTVHLTEKKVRISATVGEL